jgi:uncharacterized repeat protein (TIGR01451 family)
MIRFKFALLCTACLVFTMAGGVFAQEGGGVELQIFAETTQTEVNAEGQLEVKQVPATRVIPGDKVTYTIRYANRGTENAEKVVITNAIPEHMIYEAGSANASHMITLYSIDGGQSFHETSELWLEDASGEMHLASAVDYTHIQWTLLDALVPTEKGHIAYRATLE